MSLIKCEILWDFLNKIAIIGTILGIPATVYGIYSLINNLVIKYDIYRELNEAGGYSIYVGKYSRKDYKSGKRQNPNRQYHIKGKSVDDEKNWK